MKIPSHLHALLYNIKHFLKIVFIVLGMMFTVSIALSFTDYPFWAYYWLGTHNSGLGINPEIIVLMGGCGIPSADGLIRCYFGAQVANHFPESEVIIAIPADTALKENSPELLMRHELIVRGVDSARISFEPEGINTRTQAMNIKKIFADSISLSSPIRLVTTPEHMYRSVATFRKLGFKHVGGMPSFGTDLDEEILIRKKRKKGQAGDSQVQALALRYNMWNYLKYEITVLRELCAIGYYKLRGWM